MVDRFFNKTAQIKLCPQIELVIIRLKIERYLSQQVQKMNTTKTKNMI